MLRTSIYIDGFNLYYRALRKTSYRWLDLKALATNLLQPHNQITQIKYFTTLVTGRLDPQQPVRQKSYIRAIEKHIPELSVYYGHFLTNKTRMPTVPLTNPIKMVDVIKTEEKGSDVKLAVHLLNDAWKNEFDCAVVISNDSDLAEAMRLVSEEHHKIIGLFTPGEGHSSVELAQYAKFTKRIRAGVLSKSQLPNPIPGTTIHKPLTW